MTATEAIRAGAEGILAGFKRADATLKRNRAAADELRAEREALKAGWSELIQAGDHDEIARRSMRLAEIGRDLVRLGV